MASKINVNSTALQRPKCAYTTHMQANTGLLLTQGVYTMAQVTKARAAQSAPAAPATKRGQAAKAAAPTAPIAPTLPTGYVANATYGATPKALGLAPSQGYPQGSQPIMVLPLGTGHSAQIQGYHAALAAACGGVGKPAPLGQVLTNMAAAGVANPRRALRRACRAWLVGWQPTA
jgi:hypothetical protein